MGSCCFRHLHCLCVSFNKSATCTFQAAIVLWTMMPSPDGVAGTKLHQCTHNMYTLHQSSATQTKRDSLCSENVCNRCLPHAALLQDTTSLSQIQRVHRPQAGIALRGLNIQTPTGGRSLCRNLDLTLQTGNSLLIVGPSGCGKSSILRAIAGVLPNPPLLCIHCFYKHLDLVYINGTRDAGECIRLAHVVLLT